MAFRQFIFHTPELSKIFISKLLQFWQCPFWLKSAKEYPSTITRPIQGTTFLGKVFNDTKGSLFSIFRIFRVDTKSFEAKGSPFSIFFRFCETLFFLNLNNQLFYSEYFTILCWCFLALCVFFRSFHLVKGYRAAFIANFSWRKSSFPSWEFHFHNYEKTFSNMDFLFSVAKNVVLRILWGIFWRWECDKNFKTVSFVYSRTWAGLG